MTAPADPPPFAAAALALIACVGRSSTPSDNVAVLTGFARAVGAEGAIFTMYTKDAAGDGACTQILGCDNLWSHASILGGVFAHDPWLRHALLDGRPIRGVELALRSAAEESFVSQAARCGLASTLVVPSTTTNREIGVSVLCLGARDPSFIDEPNYVHLVILARALALEMHEWSFRNARCELLRKAHLTDAEIDLLHRAAAGKGSKAIAAELDVSSTTIDCRFQRICRRLEVVSRSAAVSLARSHGLF